MPVNTKHSSYSAHVEDWERNRKCVAGARTVKEAGTDYLPMPMPDDKSKVNLDRYKAYVERANYVNFTGATEEGMLGMVFRKPIQVVLPNELLYLTDNIDGMGLTIDQLVRTVTSNVLMTGRIGLLADYPVVEAGQSKQSVEAMNPRAKLLIYRAEDIINWRVSPTPSGKQLTLVVLKEPTNFIGIDGFDVQVKVYHRVLTIEDGVYIQRLYNEDNEQVGEDIVPRKSDGTTWDKIPFSFIGSTNNDEVVDKAPLSDIANVNIAHYINSADYEDSCYMVGQPTPWASGFSASWVKDVLKDEPVRIGSREFLLLPEGASAGLLQVTPNIMPREGMQDKEMQMIRLGARLITDAGGNETAEGAKIRFAGQNSKLSAIVGNIEAGMIDFFKHAALFMGGSEDLIEIDINKEFYDRSIDPQLVIAQIQLLDRGVIAKSDLRDNLRSGRLIDGDRTDDDIDGEAEIADIL